MSTKMLVSVKLDQHLTMSQQLRQAITLLQYNTLDLKQLVQQCLEKNPLLEVEENTSEENNDQNYDADQVSYQFGKYSANIVKSKTVYEDESALENYSIPESLRQHLLTQTLLCGFDDSQQFIAEAIIDALDDDGYLTMALEDIQKMISGLNSVTMEQLHSVLTKIQTFDPVGVGAKDIRDCLLIQLKFNNEKTPAWENALKILSHYFAELSSNNHKIIIKELSLTRQEFFNALALIRTFNPHPGAQYSGEIDANAEPELYVKKIKSTWQVFLTDSILTNVKINNQYQALIKENKKHGSYPALKQELEEAKALISGLKRRNETLFSVATYIMELQKDFLEYGQAHMKSLNIADVSKALDLHESTVSRITTGKYIATPRGVFELKYFFPSHVFTDAGEMCSDTAVKAFIKEIINQEVNTHFYSDSEIATLLEKKGIKIARRTVAKYREAMKILPSYQRMRTKETT